MNLKEEALLELERWRYKPEDVLQVQHVNEKDGFNDTTFKQFLEQVDFEYNYIRILLKDGSWFSRKIGYKQQGTEGWIFVSPSKKTNNKRMITKEGIAYV